MDSDDRLTQRVAHIRQALRELTASLQPAAAYVRPSTSTGFLPADYFDDLMLSPNNSGRSEVYALQRQLEWTEGKARRLEEKLRGMEATCREMNELMEELYGTVEELQEGKRRAEDSLVHLKDIELHYDSLRKQITTLQTAVAHKDRLLAQFHQDHDSLLSSYTHLPPAEPSPTVQFLHTEVQRLEREKTQLKENNEKLTAELRQIRDITDQEISQIKQKTGKDVSDLYRERDALEGTLSAKDAQIRDLQEKIYEKQLVADAYRQPVDRGNRDFKGFYLAVTKVLGEKSPEELVRTVQAMHTASSQVNGASALVSRLSKLILDCAPVEADTEPPTVKQIWRWVRRLVEEFMRLKETNEIMEKDWSEARKLLGVKGKADVLPALNQVISDLQQLQSLEGKVKALVRSSEPIKIEDR